MDPNSLPLVKLIGTGGTISSWGATRLTYVDYSATGQRIDASELVARVPEVAEFARVECEQFAQLGSTSMGQSEWLKLGKRINQVLAEEPEVAGVVTGSYWAMFTLGRILAGVYAKKIADSELIYLSVSFAFLGTALLLTNSGQLTSILGISVTGFAIAPIFPGLVSSTTSRVGLRHQANTIGMQMSAASFGKFGFAW